MYPHRSFRFRSRHRLCAVSHHTSWPHAPAPAPPPPRPHPLTPPPPQRKFRHIVVVPCYIDPIEVLFDALSTLLLQEHRERLVVVMAFEVRTPDLEAKKVWVWLRWGMGTVGWGRVRLGSGRVLCRMLFAPRGMPKLSSQCNPASACVAASSCSELCRAALLPGQVAVTAAFGNCGFHDFIISTHVLQRYGRPTRVYCRRAPLRMHAGHCQC
jgi:hypothetical protein